ncbi:MAG: cupin domain-containing protein [Methanothermobacter sp.]|nr:cupin domain-containing protein [Methanothermobacter sp.]
MTRRNIRDCEYFRAADGSLLCELLHPDNEGLDMGFSLAHAILRRGEASEPHRLRESVEVYYIMEGEATMHIDDESFTVREGDAIHIPAGAIQYIENTGESELSFLCIVSPPWHRDDEDVLEDPSLKQINP